MTENLPKGKIGEMAVLTLIMPNGEIDQEIFGYGLNEEIRMKSYGNGGFARIREEMENARIEGKIRFAMMREGNPDGGDSREIWRIGEIC